MKRLQAYKFELRPNGQQKRDLRRFAGSCRYVFNKALVLQQARYEHGEKKLGYAGLCTLLTQWKGQPETAWLTETPSQALQQSLKDLERAYKHFFEQRTDFPRFKKKGHSDRFRYPQGYRLDQSHSRIFLPKLGWLRYRNSRDVLGTVKNVTVSQSNGTWFVSIQTERAVEQPVHPATSIIGIDMGIARFATLSDGTFIVPLNSFTRHQQALTKAQRAMSRKVKFSHNWKKAKACVQKIHARIGNARRDFLHKTTTTISKNHAIVCLEDLQVRNMSTSAAGTVETPGRNVRAKSGLNTSILDQGWGKFRRQLDYKLSWTGGHLIAVPPHHTSQTCPACGHMSADNRQTQARFACVECGYENHADLVGALNIVAAGHAVLACGGTALSGRPMKQEPTEATRAAHAA
ncbi:MAG: transposase [Nitrospirota bacterium]